MSKNIIMSSLHIFVVIRLRIIVGKKYTNQSGSICLENDQPIPLNNRKKVAFFRCFTIYFILIQMIINNE